MKLYSYGILDYYPLFSLYLSHTKQFSFCLFTYLFTHHLVPVIFGSLLVWSLVLLLCTVYFIR
jgi:hypothetical protein